MSFAGTAPFQAGRSSPAVASTTRRSSVACARAFKGTDAEFAPIASAIEHIFGLCKTQVRYLEPDERMGIVADYAVAAAKRASR